METLKTNIDWIDKLIHEGLLTKSTTNSCQSCETWYLWKGFKYDFNNY